MYVFVCFVSLYFDSFLSFYVCVCMFLSLFNLLKLFSLCVCLYVFVSLYFNSFLSFYMCGCMFLSLFSLVVFFLFLRLYVFVFLPQGAIDWSVICKFEISRSYSLVFDLNHFCVSLAIYHAILFYYI